MCQVGVIGGGAWGTALAAHCSRMGHQTLIYAREAEVVEGINKSNENQMFLKACFSFNLGLHTEFWPKVCQQDKKTPNGYYCMMPFASRSRASYTLFSAQ